MSFADPSTPQNFPAVFVRTTPSPPTTTGRQELSSDNQIENPLITPVNSLPPPKSEGNCENEPQNEILGPRPERRMLGYISTSALILNKMIGTGIFSKPSDILRKTNSKGGALFLWFVGGLMTLSGLLVYLEFGIEYPKNGGALVYLEKSYPRPRYFASVIFSLLFVLLCNNAANAIAFAKGMIMAFNGDGDLNPDYRLQQFIALVCITFVCMIHFFSREMGIFMSNALAAYKVVLLAFVVVSGFVCLAGGGRGHLEKGTPYGHENFSDAFKTPSHNPYSYASAMLGVLYAYQGWENANYVLAEVRRPNGGTVAKTFKRAALFSFFLVTVLYVLANASYFAALTTEELQGVGISVATKFFKKVFGDNSFVTRGLPVLIAFSAFGNVVANTYTNAIVKQEIAKRRILPFSRYWEKDHAYYGTPVGALVLHWIFNVIVIVATPNYSGNDEAYNFISALWTYASTWVGIFVAIGLATLVIPRELDPVVVGRKTLYILICFYIILNFFIIVLIWWPSKYENIPPLAAPAVGTGVLVFGGLYWLVIVYVLPRMGIERQEIQINESAKSQVFSDDSSNAVAYEWNKTGMAASYSNWCNRRFGGKNTNVTG